ncbi:hypothetical protein SAMN04490206_2342 [Pseudomonas umsongensis]|jgi:hypothetical protein|nr:hypothetical protein SAMN04490206_2342 [Pseudomonas umsongensis]
MLAMVAQPPRGVDRSHALRGNAARDALRSADNALIELCATVMRASQEALCEIGCLRTYPLLR